MEPWLPAITPGTVEHWLWNEYYATDEEFLYAIADVMNQEYRLIVASGLMLQVDDPDLPDGRSLMPGVVGHSSDLIEDPELVAERLVRYAGLVGKET